MYPVNVSYLWSQRILLRDAVVPHQGFPLEALMEKKRLLIFVDWYRRLLPIFSSNIREKRIDRRSRDVMLISCFEQERVVWCSLLSLRSTHPRIIIE